MKRAAALIAALAACAEAPMPDAGSGKGYEPVAAAMTALEWSPARERQVASLLSAQPITAAALEPVVAEVRPVLDTLDAALDGSWTIPPPGAPRVSRDDWEALVWLAYGDAQLALARGDEEDAAARIALAWRLADRLAGAQGAALGDLIVAFGLAEAGALQTQRLAVLDRSVAEAGAPLPQSAWNTALRAEAVAVTDRIAAMADDAAPEASMDAEATQDAAVGLFLAAAARTLGDCAAPLALPQTPLGVPDEPNRAGRLMLADLAAALRRVDDRRCLTEAARRAAALAVLLHRMGGERLPDALPSGPGLADPFTGRPFAYDPAGGTIRSAGRDRRLATGPGRGPFDDDEPTWFLDLRPLL